MINPLNKMRRGWNNHLNKMRKGMNLEIEKVAVDCNSMKGKISFKSNGDQDIFQQLNIDRCDRHE